MENLSYHSGRAKQGGKTHMTDSEHFPNIYVEDDLIDVIMRQEADKKSGNSLSMNVNNTARAADEQPNMVDNCQGSGFIRQHNQSFKAAIEMNTSEKQQRNIDTDVAGTVTVAGYQVLPHIETFRDFESQRGSYPKHFQSLNANISVPRLHNDGIIDRCNIINDCNKDKTFVAGNTDNLVVEHENKRKDASLHTGIFNNSMANEGKLQSPYSHTVGGAHNFMFQPSNNGAKILPPSDYSQVREINYPQGSNYESQTDIILQRQSKFKESNMLEDKVAEETRSESCVDEEIEKCFTKIINSNYRSDTLMNENKMNSSEEGNAEIEMKVSCGNKLSAANFTDVNEKDMNIYTHFKKSRKQNLPKRLSKEQRLGDIDCATSYNSCDAMKSESEHPLCKDSKKIECELNVTASGNSGSGRNDDITDRVENGIVVKHIKIKYEPGLSEIDQTDEWRNAKGNLDNMQTRIKKEHCSFQNECLGPDVSYDKFGLYSPYGHMTSLDLLANMNQSLLQTTDNIGATSPSYLDDFDMVRHLRSIRCSRYRKISTAEKKEITAYAKLHGVSQAAVCYNVSKSAVSMWNRVDLNELENLCEKRKKNRMWGNEKFESLLLKVQNEKNNKFRGLTKQDKFEVSRYAKIVGVREMARCLDVALGTVSGWMRQFPYKVSSESNIAENCNDSDFDSLTKSDSELELVNAERSIESIINQETNSKQDGCHSEQNEIEITNTEINHEHYVKYVEQNSEQCASITEAASENTKCNNMNSKRNSENDTKIVDSLSAITKCGKKSTEKNGAHDKGRVEQEEDISDFETVVKDGNLFVIKTTPAIKRTASDCDFNEDRQNKKQFKMDMAENPEINGCSEKDEVDEMIAEMQKKPNVETCLSKVQHLISGTSLEGDDFFKELFDRVIACRHDKYKSLKASEKLEVVRYSRRVGVRRVARILGLATGTLSGWNNKYQSHLCLTDQNMSQCSDLNSSNLSCDLDQSRQEINYLNVPEKVQVNNSHISPHVSRHSVLDNEEKSEVTAVKFLLKEKYPIFLKKIEAAKKVKFKNVSHAEKIEIVKCTKLVGIRPTARVLNIPIGTLSGWISKYSNILHPAYHEIPEVLLPDRSNGQELESTAISYHHGLLDTNLDMLFPARGAHTAWPSSSVGMVTRSCHGYGGMSDTPEKSSDTQEHESDKNSKVQNHVNLRKPVVSNMLSKVKHGGYADSVPSDSDGNSE